MKKRFTKWIAFTAAIIISIASLNSCVKKAGGLETDFSGLQDFVIFQNGGLRTFAASNVSTSGGDTTTKTAIITLASKNVAATPVNVTVAVDDTKRTDYNAANGTTYQAPTTSMYKIVNSTVTIPAGQNYATVTVQFYGKKLDPAVSYLLPISITDASGRNLSANENTVYYNIIGNLLAGTYIWNFTRWSTPDSTTSPDGNSFTGHTTTFQPLSATTIEVASGYFIQPRYQLSFKNTNGVLSNFTLKFNPDDAAALVAGGVTVTSGPIILLADPVAKHFRFYYTTLTRAVIDEYIKQ